MRSKMRREFTGAWKARRAGARAWRLSCSAPHEAEIMIRTPVARAENILGAGVSDIYIEWQQDGVLLEMRSGRQVATTEVESVRVHEPVSRLYDVLPLAEFDSRARRFWRRVFLVVRIPGGRLLLGALARASRKRRD